MVVCVKKKKCTVCNEYLPVDLFYKKGGRLYSECKSCLLKKRKSQYQKSRKKIEPQYNKIIVSRLNGASSISKNDVIELLEAFLLEEMGYGQVKAA